MTAVPPTKPRAEDGICEQCGYALLHEQAVCPECGTTIDWEHQRTRTPSPRQPQATIATIAACGITVVLTGLSGLAAGLQPRLVLIGVAAVFALELLVIAGLGSLIRSVDARDDRAMTRWWNALAPIWLSSVVSLSPIHLVDWIMRGGGPIQPDAQAGIGILFVCIFFNALTVASAIGCSVYLWEALASRKRFSSWPTWKAVRWLFGLPIGLLGLLAIPSPTAAGGLAMAIVLPIGVPIATGWLLAMSALPHPPQGPRTRRASARVMTVIGPAIMVSAVVCGVFNFWWHQQCLLP